MAQSGEHQRRRATQRATPQKKKSKNPTTSHDKTSRKQRAERINTLKRDKQSDFNKGNHIKKQTNPARNQPTNTQKQQRPQAHTRRRTRCRRLATQQSLRPAHRMRPVHVQRRRPTPNLCARAREHTINMHWQRRGIAFWRHSRARAQRNSDSASSDEVDVDSERSSDWKATPRVARASSATSASPTLIVGQFAVERRCGLRTVVLLVGRAHVRGH